MASLPIGNEELQTLNDHGCCLVEVHRSCSNYKVGEIMSVHAPGMAIDILVVDRRSSSNPKTVLFLVKKIDGSKIRGKRKYDNCC